ncbi:hypothetical protein B0H19DRAFT_1180853 [Mycena capillaripes]|nr:hypothetical protein B0H19DRAFT_1180853 [Mycena capillaripes]
MTRMYDTKKSWPHRPPQCWSRSRRLRLPLGKGVGRAAGIPRYDRPLLHTSSHCEDKYSPKG